MAEKIQLRNGFMQISYTEEIKRKAVHLSSLWMVAATLLLASWQWAAAILFCALLALTLISEHDYANGGKYLGRLYGKLFGNMLRSEAKPGQWIVSGGAPVLAAAALVNILFAPVIAAAALAEGKMEPVASGKSCYLLKIKRLKK